VKKNYKTFSFGCNEGRPGAPLGYQARQLLTSSTGLSAFVYVDKDRSRLSGRPPR
jgi:hypothetical protein